MWNKAAGICSHSATAALVRSATDVYQYISLISKVPGVGSTLLSKISSILVANEDQPMFFNTVHNGE